LDRHGARESAKWRNNPEDTILHCCRSKHVAYGWQILCVTSVKLTYILWKECHAITCGMCHSITQKFSWLTPCGVLHEKPTVAQLLRKVQESCYTWKFTRSSSILSEINSLHTLTYYIYTVNFNIILPCIASCQLPLGFATETLYLLLSFVCCMAVHFILQDFIILRMFGREYDVGPHMQFC
jgi:hypothetical protein